MLIVKLVQSSDVAAARAGEDDNRSMLTMRDKLAYGIGTLGNWYGFAPAQSSMR